MTSPKKHPRATESPDLADQNHPEGGRQHLGLVLDGDLGERAVTGDVRLVKLNVLSDALGLWTGQQPVGIDERPP